MQLVQHRQALKKRKTEFNINLNSIQLIKQKTLQKQISDIKSLYSALNYVIQEVKGKMQQLSTTKTSTGLVECKEKLPKEIQLLKVYHTNNYHNLLPIFQPCENDDIYFKPPDNAKWVFCITKHSIILNIMPNKPK
jgi:hypothetical protein